MLNAELKAAGLSVIIQHSAFRVKNSLASLAVFLYYVQALKPNACSLSR
jgi:hypothetical protein